MSGDYTAWLLTTLKAASSCLSPLNVFVVVAGKCDLDASDHCSFPGHGSQPEATGVCTNPRGAAGSVEQQLVCQVLQARQFVAGGHGCAVPGAHLPQPLCSLVSAAAAGLYGLLYFGNKFVQWDSLLPQGPITVCRGSLVQHPHQQPHSGTTGCCSA